MSDLVAEYKVHMRRQGLVPESIRIRVRVLEMTEAACGPLLDVTSAQIEAMLDDRTGRSGQPLNTRTRVGWLSHLHCFYQWAIAHEHCTIDPTARSVRPKLRRKLPRPISEDGYRRALAEAPNDTMHAWLLLAGHAGLRCMEIAGLRGENIADGSLRVLGKGVKERVIPMHPRVAAIAVAWPTSGPVFLHVTGVPWEPYQVSQNIGKYLRRVGVNATAHQLRHRFASEMLNVCGDIALVADLLGHESLENTRIYAQVAQGRKTAAVGMLA